MCGRFVLTVDQQTIENHYNVILPDKLEPNSNVSPTQNVPIIVKNEQVLKAIFARWGLIPSWSKDKSIGYKMFNARADTIDEKPSFKSSFKSRRCLVPANGFYEWKTLDNGKKLPCIFKLVSDEMFSFAGLWSDWIDPVTKTSVVSCTIITTEPNDLVATVHDRMPVILSKVDEQSWLNLPDKSLLKPFDSSMMKVANV